MISEFFEIEAIVGHDRNHSRAAVGASNLDAVGGRIDNAPAVDDGFVHFGCRDVLAFPAESISDPVDEMEKAAFVELHQVAGSKPGIALAEHVAQDFLFGLGSVGVPLEAAPAVVGTSDPPDGFADFAAGASDTKTVGVANGRAKLRIDANDRRRKAMRQ